MNIGTSRVTLIESEQRNNVRFHHSRWQRELRKSFRQDFYFLSLLPIQYNHDQANAPSYPTRNSNPQCPTIMLTEHAYDIDKTPPALLACGGLWRQLRMVLSDLARKCCRPEYHRARRLYRSPPCHIPGCQSHTRHECESLQPARWAFLSAGLA